MSSHYPLLNNGTSSNIVVMTLIKMVFFLTSADKPADGLKYVAVAGEQSSEVCMKIILVYIYPHTIEYRGLDFLFSTVCDERLKFGI